MAAPIYITWKGIQSCSGKSSIVSFHSRDISLSFTLIPNMRELKRVLHTWCCVEDVSFNTYLRRNWFGDLTQSPQFVTKQMHNHHCPSSDRCTITNHSSYRQSPQSFILRTLNHHSPSSDRRTVTTVLHPTDSRHHSPSSDRCTITTVLHPMDA